MHKILRSAQNDGKRPFRNSPMNEKKGYVYILTNKGHNVFYVGITSDLIKRVFEHKNKFVEGFSKKYNIDQLMYYEVFENIEEAIQREKQIKGLLRSKKIALIEKMNPKWEDLYLKLL